MNTISLQSVMESILRRHGLDPVGDAVNHDTVRAIVEHVNKRIDVAWKMWDWPQLSLTEERAFRPLWSDTRQYRVVGLYGLPDEFYYAEDDTYYRVVSTLVDDPPIGTIPGATLDFEAFTDVSHYIDFNQAGQAPIGFVHGVYPCASGCTRTSLVTRPSEHGIMVCGCPSNTVIVWYAPPIPKFTMLPFLTGKTYALGVRVFWTGTGNCYRAIDDAVTTAPPDVEKWVQESLPAFLEQYIVAGAYADSLRDSDMGEDQVKLARAQMADAEAEQAIQGEIDLLLAQGQKHFYGYMSH